MRRGGGGSMRRGSAIRNGLRKGVSEPNQPMPKRKETRSQDGEGEGGGLSQSPRVRHTMGPHAPCSSTDAPPRPCSQTVHAGRVRATQSSPHTPIREGHSTDRHSRKINTVTNKARPGHHRYTKLAQCRGRKRGGRAGAGEGRLSTSPKTRNTQTKKTTKNVGRCYQKKNRQTESAARPGSRPGLPVAAGPSITMSFSRMCTAHLRLRPRARDLTDEQLGGGAAFHAGKREVTLFFSQPMQGTQLVHTRVPPPPSTRAAGSNIGSGNTFNTQCPCPCRQPRGRLQLHHCPPWTGIRGTHLGCGCCCGCCCAVAHRT